MRGGQRSAQGDACERGAATERNIELSGSKSAAADVNSHLIKGLTLAFVDGDGPGQPHRKLGERAGDFGDNFAAGQSVAKNLPCIGKDIDQFGIVLQADSQIADFLRAGFDFFNTAEAAVYPAAFEIVVQKHDLGAGAQFQDFGGRKILGLKIAVYHCLRDTGRRIEAVQMFGIEFGGHFVGGGEGDINSVWRRQHAPVEGGKIGGGGGVVADARKQADEVGVGLAIDFVEFDDFHIHSAKSLRTEEIRSGVAGGKILGFRRADNRRQLKEIAHQDNLHAAERFLRIRSIQAQKNVNAVKDIGAQHGGFVNEEGLQPLIDAFGARRKFIRRDFFGSNVDGKPEKTVNGLAADIERGHTGGSHHGDIPPAVFDRISQQGGFSGAGFAGDKQVTAAVDKVKRLLKLGVDVNLSGHNFSDCKI